MKICAKCNEEFKTYVKIDGKPKNLNKRIYCLECSPYKDKKNNRKLHIVDDLTKKCPKCNIVKTKDCFYIKQKGTNNLSPYCKNCTAIQCKERTDKFKQDCVNYLGGKCKSCGYDKCIAALEFHHLDPSKKEFNISYTKWHKFDERILNELNKCILLCANCHRELHFKQVPEVGLEPT